MIFAPSLYNYRPVIFVPKLKLVYIVTSANVLEIIIIVSFNTPEDYRCGGMTESRCSHVLRLNFNVLNHFSL